MSDYSQIKLDDEMRHSYIEYAMSVIVGRALPDVRDGLKPVHRRVLYSMHELNNGYNKAYKKSARIVGDVIGKYHPHGDTAVYDTIVRLAQPFSMRYPLVDGQGNFGSIDGDSPAAMRYTEVRMSRLSHELLSDIDKNTVDFNPNYDGSEREPTVLPTRLPNLLINGASGIAVGMATNIPPHNLNEVIDGVITLIKEPSLSDEDNLGWPNIYWRLVRPKEKGDVGPLHRDSWFWELNDDFPTPEYDFYRLKVWLPIFTEIGLNGLLLEPFSQKRVDIKWSGEKRHGINKPTLISPLSELNPKLINDCTIELEVKGESFIITFLLLLRKEDMPS